MVRAAPCLTLYAMTASRTTPTLWVLVIMTGAPSSPDSSTQVVPVISPLPLSENQAAKTGSLDPFPRGRMAVTPVRTGPFADHQFPVAGDQGRVADLDAVHIGDRIEGPRRAFEGDAEVAGAGLGLLREASPGGEEAMDREGEDHKLCTSDFHDFPDRTGCGESHVFLRRVVLASGFLSLAPRDATCHHLPDVALDRTGSVRMIRAGTWTEQRPNTWLASSSHCRGARYNIRDERAMHDVTRSPGPGRLFAFL